MHNELFVGPLASTEESRADQERGAHALSPIDILESISDAFVAVDRDWRFAYVNAKAAQVFRMPPSRLIGQRCWELFPEGVRTEGQRRLKQAMDENRSVAYLEYSLRYRIWYEVTAYPHSHGLSIYFRDVTQRVAAEQKLLLQERAIEASLSAIVITTSKRHRYAAVYVNPAFERVTGYCDSEVLGRNCSFLQGGDTDQPEIAALRALLESNEQGRVTLRNYRKNGELFHNELHIAPVRDSRGKVTHFVGVLNDITETRRYQEELERHINHDPLTGLANRHLLKDRLEHAVTRAQRHEARCALIFLDLDLFKQVNDGLGHHIGDVLLREISTRLIKLFRPEDTVARFGGDEFVIVVDELGGQADLVDLVERVRERLTLPVVVDAHEISISASLGIAVYPEDGGRAEELLRNADTAMYDAKARGRNTFSFYRREMNQAIARRFELKARLARALEHEELTLHYQPQASAGSRAIVGLEALLRWQSPACGMVPPDQFIPLAEETGLIVPIGEWVIERACRFARPLVEEGLLERIAVNLSMRQFYQPAFARTIERILTRTAMEPEHLELEITESMMVGDTRKVIRILNELKEMRVTLAIDDFGTGYSSLGYLRHFPIDRLKIDRSFISDVPANRHDCTLARSVISLGHNLGLKVVAEGVETAAQLQFLVRNRCDEVQGYLLGRPAPEHEVSGILKASGSRTSVRRAQLEGPSAVQLS